jgi:hypothetical protein
MATPRPPVDFDAFPRVPYWMELREPVFDLLTFIVNKIERERRAELEARARGMRMFLLTHVRIARRTYEVIEALASDRKQIALSIEISVAIAPLSRQLLESLFSIAYVFDDASVRLPKFWHCTWAKIAEEHIQNSNDYGNDPLWTDWLKDLAEQRDGWQQDLAKWGTPVPAALLANPTARAYRWPNPGRMVSDLKDPWRAATLKYLNDRYYGPLSNMAHLSGTGVLAQGGTVMPDQPEAVKRKYFSDRFLGGFTMLMALISQFAVDVIPEPAFARRLVALWTNPRQLKATHEVYERCFKVKLEPLSNR